MLQTPYDEILNPSNSIQDILVLGGKEKVSAATNDAQKTLLLVIDNQVDFIEGGSLAVPGALEDSKRLTKWMYENLDGITRIMCSLDTHNPLQIFFPIWWIDEDGNNPDPFTIISYEDLKNNKWKPAVGDPKKSIEYVKNLEANSKKQLCIWPYHCLGGTPGASLEENFYRMMLFHSVARNSIPAMIQKGTNPFSEMYGIIKPEYDPGNFINKPILDAIQTYNRILIAGQAKSHCVLESLFQILDFYSDSTETTEKIIFLNDCTSCIPGNEDATEKAFEGFVNQYGITIANSTDIKL